jgi:hypothetical protein
MIVTLALLGPFVQSVSLTGGNFDSAVGPGVGFWVTTVQPESGSMEDSSGTVSTTVGTGLATVVEVEVGIAWVWGRQPTRGIASSSTNDKNTLRIQFSIDNYFSEAILPVKS